MRFLDRSTMNSLLEGATSFQQKQPYPWVAIQNFVYPDRFAELCRDLPDPSLFDAQMGYRRAHGQRSHDRLALQYRPALEPQLAPSWRERIIWLLGSVSV
ncbi:MAG: hypothetical protein U7M05_09460 [Candidatus Igneacidithiobacillus chanchocoensis]